MGGKHKREHHHPIDINSDDHTTESDNPTLTYKPWEPNTVDHNHGDGDEGGDDREGGPDHWIGGGAGSD